MVYYGALSTGCEECRSRKVKCDGRRPGCERCEKYGHSCPGYRDLLTVAFRSENQRIAQRVANKHGSKRKPKGGDDSGAQAAVVALGSADAIVEGQPRSRSQSRIGLVGQESETTADHQKQLQIDQANQLIPAATPIGIGQNEAVCFFQQQFSWQTVPMHFSRWHGVPEVLVSTSAAIGLAMLSFMRHAPELERNAYTEYGAALQLVNNALSKPATATSDSTLAVVILMSFFEIISGCSVSSVNSWTNHASGAASIIRLRGPSQLHSPIGYQLFLEAKGMLVTTGLIFKTYVPPIMTELTEVAMEIEPPAVAHAGRLFILLAEVADLRADIQACAIKDLNTILPRVNAIESKLHSWREAMPSSWLPETVQLPGSNPWVETECGKVHPHEGRYFVYQADYVAVGWTEYHVARILLGEILLDAFKPLVSDDVTGVSVLRTMCSTTRQDMNQMAWDTCASIPYLLGLSSSVSYGVLGVGGVVKCLLPLWFAARVEGVGHPLRENASSLFGLMAERAGIAHALLELKALAHISGMVEWLDYLPLGKRGKLKITGRHDKEDK